MRKKKEYKVSDAFFCWIIILLLASLMGIFLTSCRSLTKQEHDRLREEYERFRDRYHYNEGI